MKLRAYLVDDEPLALSRLRRMLEHTGRVEVIGSTSEPEEAVEALTTDPPDVCFLDIQMPRLNGFEVLARLPKQPVVIFTTAFDQYALKAFEVNSVDYLLKPIKEEDIKAINVPAFIIIGTEDVVRPEHAVEMYRLLPHGQLAILPGAHGEFIGEITTAQDKDFIAGTVSMIEKFLSGPVPKKN